MAEMQFDLKGPQGIIAIVAVVIIGLLRLGTLNSSHDPKLHDAIKTELRNELGNNLGKALANMDSRDPDALKRAAALANGDGIEIYSTKLSKPLLSWSSSQKVVVKLSYSLPEQPRRQEYWSFNHSFGSWSYVRETTVVSYYLNLI